MTSITVGLVGNPNCGKTTIFNGLTQSKQKVGNFSGVTVERKSGEFQLQSKKVEVIDLPGIYQFSYSADQQAVDEKIASQFILNHEADVIVNIVDAAHLERHLYLTLQLLTLNVPLIIAVNMLDIAKRRQIDIDLVKLQSILGCPVVSLVAKQGKGIHDLKRAIINYDQYSQPAAQLRILPSILSDSITELAAEIQNNHPSWKASGSWLAEQILQDPDSTQIINPSIRQHANWHKEKIEQELGQELDIVFADSFYTAVSQITEKALKYNDNKPTYTEKIDKVILNRWLGVPIFLGVMYVMFLFAINLGGAFQDFFDITSETFFVQGVENSFKLLHAPSWITALFAAGFGKGINTVVSFIPVIGSMFFFLAMLEESGYMARASVVVDRLMRILGLPGKSFVPMIVGFGCNVPAILGARTLETERDRILTIMMSPFMSCGARLAIFAVFTAAFFPTGGQNIVFLLYLIGIITAILTGFLLRKTLLKGKVTPLILELPAYHLPPFLALIKSTWHRLKSFLFDAGKLIVPICMLIGFLNTLSLNDIGITNENSQKSILSSIGQEITPILSPIGIHQDNWPATVGLVTGTLAKEVVVATLNTLYSQVGQIGENSAKQSSIWINLQAAVMSIPHNLIALKDSFTNPVAASVSEDSLNKQVYGVMYQRFGGKIAAFAYLLFVLLYFPCVSATAAIAKELNKNWSLFSVAWSTLVAYSIATLFYQLGTFYFHPISSLIWLFLILSLFTVIISLMKKCGKHRTVRESACTVSGKNFDGLGRFYEINYQAPNGLCRCAISCHRKR